MKKPTRDELLAHYARREPVAFMQFDGFSGVPLEDVTTPDQEGDAVMAGETFELMSGAYAVRVLISRGTDAPTAERLLTKILAVHKENRKLLETYTQVEPFLPPAATSGIAPALTKIATSDFSDDTQELPF